jgi:hypothetical protein
MLSWLLAQIRPFIYRLLRQTNMAIQYQCTIFNVKLAHSHVLLAKISILARAALWACICSLELVSQAANVSQMPITPQIVYARQD